MIQKIRSQNFRNLKDQVWQFSPKTTVIIGPNAAGKTNLLESIYLLSSGKSFKASIESEMIKENEIFGRVKGLTSGDLKLEIILSRESHKKFLVNGVSKRQIDFVGNIKVVLFAPQDLDLVTSSPSLRRKFLDNVLSLTDREYRRAVLSYEKGLRARNKLLFRIREEGLPRTQLLFWNQLLIKNGDYISNMRQEFISFINQTKPLKSEKFSVNYDKSAISEERFETYAREEVAAANTLVGPHRDDFIFMEEERNLSHFGSRGEQRMIVLWLKLAELAFIEQKSGEKPTLLLDDIFSELDEKHRGLVFKISEEQQTIITTADPDFIKNFNVAEKIDMS